MAVNISNEFHRTSTNPIDDSLTLTKAQMLAISDNIMPNKYFTICQDDGYIYLYDKSATASLTTGKFTKFEGGDTSDCIKFDSGDVIHISGKVFGDDIIPNGDNVMNLGDTTNTFYKGYINHVETFEIKLKYNYQNDVNFDRIFIEDGYDTGEIIILKSGSKLTIPVLSYTTDAKVVTSTDGSPVGSTLSNSACTIWAGLNNQNWISFDDNYELDKACEYSVTDNSISTALTSSDTKLVTGRSVYYHCVNGYAPIGHASTNTTYGTGNASNYGHLKLSSSVASTSGESGGVAATPYAVKAAYDLASTANDRITSGIVMFVLHFNIGTGSVSGVSINNLIGSVTLQSNTSGYSVSGSEIPNSGSYGVWFKVSVSKKFRGCVVSYGGQGITVKNGTGSNRISGLMSYQEAASQYIAIGATMGYDVLIIGY